MSMRGRPLRFLGLVGGGWISARILLLWPVTGSLPQAIREVLPIPMPSAAADLEGPRLVGKARPSQVALHVATAGSLVRPAATARRQRDPALVQPSLLGMIRYEGVPQRLPRSRRIASAPPTIGTLPVAAEPPAPSRLSGSAWLIGRSDGDATGPRLGGSQAGVRLRYRIDARDRLALAARVATPLAGVGREAALGVEWRPFDAPVAFIAEQRVGFGGARGGPTLMAAGGIDAVPLAADVALSAYVQAGAVARDRIEPFFDGAVRVARPIAAIGTARVEIGAGAWGAAQRGAERIDIGPGVAAVVPVAGRSLRIGLDWRERVAGGARPGSGVALSIGTDF